MTAKNAGPGEHSRCLINETGGVLRGLTTRPDGEARSNSAKTLTEVAAVNARLAIASALLDVADAIRSLKPPTPPTPTDRPEASAR